MNKNYGFSLELELAHKQDTDWQFGALSEPALYTIPANKRDLFQPIGERQNIGEEKNSCASFSPINNLEFQFTYADQTGLMLPENKKWGRDNGYATENGVWSFSDRFIAILSGTDPLKGNSLKAPIDTIHRKGLIPKKMFPQVESRNEYYDKSKITDEMLKLGEEFLKRFTINYEHVREIHFAELLKEEMVCAAGYAWPSPRDGVYPKTTLNPNHAFLLYNLPKYQAFDSYLDWNKENTAQVEGDFTKNLASDYDFWDTGYRIYVSQERLPKEEGEVVEKVFQTLLKFNLLGFFADFIKRFFSTPPSEEKPEETKPEETPSEKPIYDWSNPKAAKHSARVIMDEYKLTWDEKNLLCAVIQAESGFNPKAKLQNKKNGQVWSTDWGICQINDYYWIGAGKTFPSVEMVLGKPELSIRFLIQKYKAGRLDLWVAYKNGSYKKYL